MQHVWLGLHDKYALEAPLETCVCSLSTQNRILLCFLQINLSFKGTSKQSMWTSTPEGSTNIKGENNLLFWDGRAFKSWKRPTLI